MMLDENIVCVLEVLNDSDDNPTYKLLDEEKDNDVFSGFEYHEDMLNQHFKHQTLGINILD